MLLKAKNHNCDLVVMKTKTGVLIKYSKGERRPEPVISPPIWLPNTMIPSTWNEAEEVVWGEVKLEGSRKWGVETVYVTPLAQGHGFLLVHMEMIFDGSDNVPVVFVSHVQELPTK